MGRIGFVSYVNIIWSHLCPTGRIGKDNEENEVTNEISEFRSRIAEILIQMSLNYKSHVLSISRKPGCPSQASSSNSLFQTTNLQKQNKLDKHLFNLHTTKLHNRLHKTI